MLEAPRPPNRVLAARRPRDVDVYGGSAETERPQPNIFAVIWRRRWIVLACVLLSIIGGVVYYLKATPIYASTATIYVQDNALKMVNDPMGTGGRSQAYLFTQCQVITSTAILGEALQNPAVATAKTLNGQSNPVGVLKSSISAAPDKLSDLINVSMESTSAQDAAVLVNAVVEAYILHQSQSHKSTALEVLKIFEKSRKDYDTALTTTQSNILELKKNNPDLTFSSDRGNLVTTKLGELADRLLKAQLRQIDIKSAVAEAEVVKDDPASLRRAIAQFANSADPDLSSADPGLLAGYKSARRNLDELRDRLGQRHDLVKSTERQVGRMEEELQQTTREAAVGYQNLLRQALRIADNAVADAQRVYTEARTSAVALNFKQAEFEQYKRDEDRLIRSIDLVDSRMKEINVNEDVGSLTVSVLESAKPGYIVRPLPTKVMGMALVAGLMAGVGLAMLRDLLDQRLRSSEEITALLDLPILGAVPHIMSKKDVPNGRLVQIQPRSNVAECYRTIRTALSFGNGDGNPTKTILFTSPAPGDGKSTCVSNLALAFAQSGRRTLLIDADCRRPTQDRVYDLEDGPGLADVLGGKREFADCIRKSELEKLDILPCGHIPSNPAELLDSQALLDLLGHVASEYDQVLIDSPPVIAVTDARILAASCDASVLVLRADRSTRRLAEHARDALQSVGANLLGVIVNDVPRGQSGYGYDYYGSSKYGYKSIAATPGGSVATNGQHSGDNGALSVPGSRTIDG